MADRGIATLRLRLVRKAMIKYLAEITDGFFAKDNGGFNTRTVYSRIHCISRTQYKQTISMSNLSLVEESLYRLPIIYLSYFLLSPLSTLQFIYRFSPLWSAFNARSRNVS
jgi:hypothetical protein